MDLYNPDNLVNNLNDLNYNESILKNIYKNLKKKDSIKLLDYGSGNAEFSLFKKKYKIQRDERLQKLLFTEFSKQVKLTDDHIYKLSKIIQKSDSFEK